MSKLKFNISFKKAKDENEKPITEVKVNTQVIGRILPPNYITFPKKNSGYSETDFHITLNVRFLGELQHKTLKPTFATCEEAKDYLIDNLYSIHCQSHLYMDEPKRKLTLRSIKSGYDWLGDL